MGKDSFGSKETKSIFKSGFFGKSHANFHFSVRRKGVQLAAMIQDQDYEDVNHQMVEAQANILGPELWELISNVVELIWRPDDMYQYLVVAATRLQNQGLQFDHLGDVGSALHFAMQTALKTGCGGCGIGDWFKDDSDGWYWLWTLCTQMMEKTLKGKELGFAQAVRESWELIKSRSEPAEIGDTMYCELRTESPHLMKLFHRPRKSQAFMFMQALELIVTFGEDPGRFMEQLRTLTLRHIKYGVKTEHIYPFGRAIISGIEKLLGRDWNKDFDKAWADVWDRAMKTTAHLFNVDSNVVIVAVVKGEVETLRELVAFAPRGERINWMTEVELNGHKISPIYWSIGDGKLDIAQFMIRDALAIRADSERYYYGKELLFERHKNLFEVLCERCPALIEDVLDGLLWHSQIVVDGAVRVNYYIKELYGDPDEFQDPWKTPLAILCTKGSPEFFYHPAMKKCLELKWTGFVKKYFVILQGIYAVFLGIFIMGFLEKNKDEAECTRTAIGLRMTSGSFGCLTVVVMTAIIMSQIRTGQMVKQTFFRKISVHVPRLLANQWNFMRYFSMIALCVATVFEPCWFPHLHIQYNAAENYEYYSEDYGADVVGQAMQVGRRIKKTQGSNEDWGDPDLVIHKVDWYMILLGVTGLAMCTQLIQLLIVSTQLAGLTYMVGKLLSDVTRNMVIMVIVIMGFALFLTALKEPYFEYYGDSALILTMFMVGLEVPPFLEMSAPGMCVLILFIIISDIGLLSILVAQLAIAYEQLSMQNIGYAQMNRAFVCVEVESVLPLSWRRKLYKALEFEKPLEFESGDEGPPGGIQVNEPASVQAHQKYIPDRIMRSTGPASEMDPWPKEMHTDLPDGASKR